MGVKLFFGNEAQCLTLDRVQRATVDFNMVDNRQSLPKA